MYGTRIISSGPASRTEETGYLLRFVAYWHKRIKHSVESLRCCALGCTHLIPLERLQRNGREKCCDNCSCISLLQHNIAWKTQGNISVVLQCIVRKFRITGSENFVTWMIDATLLFGFLTNVYLTDDAEALICKSITYSMFCFKK